LASTLSSDGEIISDEGKALAQALREARAALEAARQYVTSPYLDSCSAAAPREDVEVEGTLRTDRLDLEEEHIAKEAAPPAVEVAGPSTAVAAAADGKPKPPAQPQRKTSCSPEPKEIGQRINELHVRCGENLARERVQRAKSLDLRERRAMQAEEKARAAKAEEDNAQARVMRHQAARRAASERRAAKELKQQEEERRSEEAARKQADARAGRMYACSAARRAASERNQRQALASEVLADLHVLQGERRKIGNAKGEELQQRCQEADWGHAKSVVEHRRKMPPRGPSPAPDGVQEPREGTSIPTLPRVLPSPRGRGGRASSSRAAASRTSSASVHLPPIAG